MLIKTIPVGHLDTNCYIVTNEQTLDCVVIDPGAEANAILAYLEDNKLRCEAILLTHGHFDHTGGVEDVAAETGATVYMGEADDAHSTVAEHMGFSLPEGGHYFQDGETLELAGLSFHIMATPGHTPGGVTIRCEDALFTGDTLFKGSCGRVDLGGGSMEQELASIRRICALEGDYEVYPGHMDCSTLARERELNYYCRLAMRG